MNYYREHAVRRLHFLYFLNLSWYDLHSGGVLSRRCISSTFSFPIIIHYRLFIHAKWLCFDFNQTISICKQPNLGQHSFTAATQVFSDHQCASSSCRFVINKFTLFDITEYGSKSIWILSRCVIIYWRRETYHFFWLLCINKYEIHDRSRTLFGHISMSIIATIGNRPLVTCTFLTQ